MTETIVTFAAVDQDGMTRGVAETGEFATSGEIASWMQAVASTVSKGQDLDALIARLDPARSTHLRQVRDAMRRLGLLREAPPAVAVSWHGPAVPHEVARWCTSGHPTTALGVGPLRGDWVSDVLLRNPAVPVGLVLTTSGEAHVIGPSTAEDIETIVSSMRRGPLVDGAVAPDPVVTACAQLLRRCAAAPRPLHGLTSSDAGTRRWVLSPHPWAVDPGSGSDPASQTATAAGARSDESFDERVMELVDPVHGAIVEVAEDDLPQVPRHLSRARVRGAGPDLLGIVDVVADGATYEDARRAVVRRALAVRAELVVDPRRLRPGPARGVDHATLVRATQQCLADPADYRLVARRLSDGTPSEVTLAEIRRDGRPGTGMSVAFEPGEALREALLGVLTDDVRRRLLPEHLVAVAAADIRDTLLRELQQLRALSEDVWLADIADCPVPGAAVGTRFGVDVATATTHDQARHLAVAQASVRAQLVEAGRGDSVPCPSAEPVPGPDHEPRVAAVVDGRSVPPTLDLLTRAVVRAHPDAHVVRLDHDPALHRIGLFALKVVSRS